MSSFDRFRRVGERPPEAVDLAMRQKLVELVLGLLRDQNGRIRVEDAISAAATIVGERCIDAAGDYALRDHELTPGSRAFSTRANELICGDVSDGDVNQIPKDSIIGVLRSREDRVRCLRIATEGLAEILSMVASAIDHRLALTLAIETANGMSKTAPMTAKAMRQGQQRGAQKAG